MRKLFFSPSVEWRTKRETNVDNQQNIETQSNRTSMSLHSGFFPAYGCRRKQNSPGYHIHLNNQQHHPATSNMVQSARSSIENVNGTDSTINLPSLVNINVHQNGQRPYRRNDFANNHLFLAKRKLARLFLDQPARPLQATSDLIHLFDTQEPKRQQRIRTKSKRHVSSSICFSLMKLSCRCSFFSF